MSSTLPATIGERLGRNRAAWADVYDSSEHLDDSQPQEPPPVVEDTYESQGLPDDLPGAMSSRVSLQVPGRSSSTMSVADDNMGIDGSASAAAPPAAAASMNPSAAPFVPRASGGQTLQEVVSAATTSAEYAPTRGSRTKRPSWSAGALQPQRAFKRSRGMGNLEEVDEMEATRSLSSGGSSGLPTPHRQPAQEPSPPRGSPARGGPAPQQAQRPATLQEPSPPRGSPPRTSPARGSVPQAQPRAAVDGEEPTEEDWQRRIDKRRSAISNFKETADYKEYSTARDEGDESAMQVPRTPDPDDRELSKRTWESQVAGWRNAVKELPKSGTAA
mmetsp:Transcript_7680/g.16889  ORF Transcript_7680/g.16889 Transcript_7680/m.16889 type:complete len:331 (-) Transcript_7680:19-1011(-)